ncbi:MAG: GFA family protein [Rhizobiaceae bacterium]
MKQVYLPSLPFEGGCQCGAVRYRATGTPLVFYLCHCTECQRHTSSAFGESLRFAAEEVEITGTISTTWRTAESGRKRFGHFCPSCGVRLLHGSEGGDEVNIKAGTLDDTAWLYPAGHIWTRSSQPFMRFGDDELVYECQPDDGYEALRERWRKMTG